MLNTQGETMQLDTSPTQSTVFIVDNDVSVRTSLTRLVHTSGWRPEPFTSAEEFLSRPRPAGPCCLVCDLSLPGLSGLELQRSLAERVHIPIIFVSGNADVRLTVQAMKSGAIEFLMKPVKFELLLDAIRDGLARSAAAWNEHLTVSRLNARYASLTPREREVMKLVVAGLLNKQIGGELGISEITVKAHRGQMTRKMKADSVPHLVMMAATLGLHAGRPRIANLAAIAAA
jgi:FixJ family two-component response regulator